MSDENVRKLESESDGFEEMVANLKFPAKANAECHLKSNNVGKKNNHISVVFLSKDSSLLVMSLPCIMQGPESSGKRMFQLHALTKLYNQSNASHF